jgi:hypothetical protein
MIGHRHLSVILILTLLLASPASTVRASTLPNEEPASPETTLPETLQGIPGATDGWWTAVQEEIRQSVYQITWQEHIYLVDLLAPSEAEGAGAYQAPNRAHNLRTYFTPSGVLLIPRVFEGATPPWEWGLTLTGYGYTGDVQSVPAATLQVDENRIEYRRGDPSAGSGQALTEWYVNDERGLEQGFTLPTAPQSKIRNPQSEIVLDLALSGNLTAALVDDGQTIEFSSAPSPSSGQAGGVRVLRYGKLVVYDAAGRQLPARLSLSRGGEDRGEGGIRITFDATGALYPITIDPLATSPNWTAESDQVGANFGWSVGTAGDVNGDGYSDVIVGAPLYDGGHDNEGQAYVYHGSPTGLTTSPNWTAESDQAGANFGYSVGTAGDVNGDGYSDVIVGAPYYDSDETDEGLTYVYHGSATGLSTTADWTAESDQIGASFGYSVGTAGDVNGDGYSDVIVGAPYYDNDQTDEGWAYVYQGSATGLAASVAWTAESDQAGASFGWSVGTAGDVNGDGYSDVIVGAPLYNGGHDNEGRAYFYHGSSTGLATSHNWTAESDQAGANFGYSVGTAGDVNGDGYSDVIVSAPLYDSDETDEGRAYVYHGSTTGLSTVVDWTVESDQADANFGWSVRTVGDVNGDGYSDVIVGAPYYGNGQNEEGRAYVYHGSAMGLSSTADWTVESDLADIRFGYSVGTAGDVNGDGYSDVIVGAPYYTNDQTAEGRAYVYHSSAAGLSSTVDWTAESNQDGALFGYSVAMAGDVNGDGYSDVIVGARYYDSGEMDEGQAYVYHGSATGLSTTADWTAGSGQAFAYFGTLVGTAGDVNGDGYSDVIVGAPKYDNGHDNEGRTYVYHGSATGLSTTVDWTVESDQDNARFGYSVGTAGDVNGDGYSDVIVGAYNYDNPQFNEGRVYVYHGSVAGLSTTANWTAESDQTSAYFGYSVGTAGDVNGDGYSDVIVGAPNYDNGETNEGRTYVYHGSAEGLSITDPWIAESDQVDAYFGYSVGTAGNVNGDGYSDVIVGAYRYYNGQTDEGRAYVYHGSAAGLSTTAAWTAESDQAYANFGYSVGTAGDVNGDDYSDVIVGAVYYDDPQMDEGQAYVYHGSAAGLSTTAAWTAESDQGGASFGYSVGTAGDVNGDGYSDVVVGAPDYDNDPSNEGRAFVYFGNGGDGLHLLPRQMRSDGSAPIAHLGKSDSHTAFQLSLIGRMPLGREDVRLQWQVAPLGTPITATTGVISGTSGWTDVLTTGVEISQTITVTQKMPYHWRVRLLYRPGNALGQPAGRWVHIPWAGWNETDLRTTLNQLPEADAGPKQAVDTNALVTLDGSGSSDPDGDLPLTYYWTQTGGTAVTLSDPAVVMPTFTAPPEPVVLAFTLVVTDSLGLTDPTPDEVLVIIGKQPPVADAGLDQAVDTNALVTLDGSDSSDPDGNLPLTYHWTQTGGTAVTLSDPAVVTPTFNAPSDPAVLTFTLVVTDSLDMPDTTPDEVVVTIFNQPPETDAGSDQAMATNALVTLDGSGSSDPDDDLPLTYHWTQTGGTAVDFTPALSVTTFTAPPDPVVLTFTLVVTDSLGLPDTTPDEVVVTIANRPPEADAGLDQAVYTNALVTLDGSGSSDPDGNLPLTYHWTQTGGMAVTLSDPAVVMPTFNASSDPAVLTFTLVVTDSLGMPDPTPDEVVVTVVEWYRIYLPLVVR